MKLLLEIEDRVRPDSTCVYFKRAFEKLCDVTVVYPEQLHMVRPKLFDLHVRIDYGINNPFPIDLKPSVYYAIDTHIDLDWRLDMVKKSQFDYVFCAQYPGTQHDWGTRNVKWLPLACDPEIHGNKEPIAKVHDVCFIGNCQPGWQKRRIERLDKLFKAVPSFYYGNVYFKDVAKKYAQSKIVFNSAHSNDINMRVFEAMASGSFLLTDKQEWNDIFKSEVYFAEYDDYDMVTKALYYLKNDSEREKIALKAKNEVLQNHTYDHRCKEILKVCGF